LKVDPKHQRSPMVKLLGSKAHRLGNPIPFEQRIFKCVLCSDHFYFTEEVKGDKTCKNCRAKNRSYSPEAQPSDTGPVAHVDGDPSISFTRDGDFGDEMGDV